MPIWDQLQDKAESLLKAQSGQHNRPVTPDNQHSVPSAPPPSAVHPNTSRDDRWNFDKVKNALQGDSTHNEQKVEEAHAEIRRETEAKEKKGISGLFDKLQDMVDGGDEKRLMEELIKLEAEDKTLKELDDKLESNRDIGDKIKDKLTGGDPAYLKEKERIRVERERVRLAREKVEAQLKEERNDDGRRNLIEKFKGSNDRIEQIRRREAEIQREKAEGKWMDKLKDRVDGETEEERQLRTEREQLEQELKGSWSYQVRDLLGKAPQDPKKQPEKPFDVKNKLNEALGGGDKGEREEDRLDKAIDMFQQHVMKAGDQSNESAIEQQKDEAIATGIRRAFGAATGKPSGNN